MVKLPDEGQVAKNLGALGLGSKHPYLDQLKLYSSEEKSDVAFHKWIERVDSVLLRNDEATGIASQQEFRIARAVTLKDHNPGFVSLTTSLAPALPFLILALMGSVEWGPSVAAGFVAALFPAVAHWIVYFEGYSDAAAAAIIADRASRDDDQAALVSG